MYSRSIDGSVLTLSPSGWTYDRVFVLYDKETGTLWYPINDGLVGIQGPYFQSRLSEIPSFDTNWGDWVEKHPDSSLVR